MEHDVFISYSSLDKEAANALCHTLEDCKIRCWIAPRDIPAGAQYGDLIDEAIKKSKVVVILFSETAAISPWVNGEMNIAFEEQKVIIPFRLDKTPLEGQNRLILNQKHWIDAYPDYKAKFDELISAVSDVLGRERTKELKCKEYSSIRVLFKREWAYIASGVTIFVQIKGEDICSLKVCQEYEVIIPYKTTHILFYQKPFWGRRTYLGKVTINPELYDGSLVLCLMTFKINGFCFRVEY